MHLAVEGHVLEDLRRACFFADVEVDTGDR